MLIRTLSWGLMQLNDGQIGQMNEVAHGWSLNGDMLIGHQAKAVEIVGSGDDIDGEAWRIGVQIGGKDTNLFIKLYRFRQLLYCFRFGFVQNTNDTRVSSYDVD